MFKTIPIIVMAVLCLNFNSRAQSQKTLPLPNKQAILGKVVSATTGEALPGAAIKIITPNHATISNDKGEFILTLSNGTYNISISHLSYKTKNITIQVPLKEPLVITLQADDKKLNEVEIVSTGYQNIPKERATGSFVHIDEYTINRSTGINILDRLEGVTSGLLLNRGLPTQGGANNAKIAIRGRSTLFANAEPTIVLDGFPYNGNIDQINPADISSITILKDAAAASIWGAKSSNGVIVINTKKGRKNQKMSIGASSTLTVSQKPDLYYSPQISSFGYIDLQQYLFSKGYYTSTLNTEYSPVSPAIEIFNKRKENKISSADSALLINELINHDVRIDLKQHFYRPAAFQQYHLNIRGGTDNQQYYLSGGYDKNHENLVTDAYERISLRVGNVYSLFKERLRITTGINYTSGKATTQSSPYTPYTPYDRVINASGNSLPVVNSLTLRAGYADIAGDGKLLDWKYRPIDELIGNNINRQNQYIINLELNYKIFNGLNFDAKYQYMREDNIRQIENPVDSYYTRNLINRYSSIVGDEVIRGMPLGGILERSTRGITSKITRFQLNYNKTFSSSHEITAIAGYEFGDKRLLLNGQTYYGYDPSTHINSNATINPLISYKFYYNTSSSRISTAPSFKEEIDIAQSYYINASYSYKRKYTFSASARKDESNLFGVKTNQKGVPLWSTGIGWNINRESFYHLDWLPLIKMRLTYGYNGNVDKSVSGLLTVKKSVINQWGNVYSNIVNPPNPDLRWERVKTWNLGLDFSGARNWLSGSIDFYQKDSHDLIGNSVIAGQSGVTQFRGNNANLRTKGIDLVINSKILTGKLSWASSFLLNYSSDKVTHYSIKQISNRNIVVSNFNNPLEGYPYYALFSYPSAGLDNIGMPQGYFEGIISKSYSTIANVLDPNQIRFHGSASPLIFGSLINTFQYQNFQLSFNLIYKMKYNFRRINVFNGNATAGPYKSMVGFENRWQNPGDELLTNIPALAYPDNTGLGEFFQNSDALIEKGDHIRLQDIRLSYQISGHRIFNGLVKGANFFLNAKNLGIIWRKNNLNLDPDYGSIEFPAPLSYSAGFNFNF